MNTTFGIGNVLRTGFRVWVRNFVPFTLITALIYSPLAIWAVSLTYGAQDSDELIQSFRSLQYALLLTTPLNIVVSAALTYGVVMELQGRRASIGACIATGLARFFPVLGVAMLSLLCIAGAALALLIPGFIVFCMLYVATQAAVLERPGVRGALKRSSELTRGHKMEIFGLVIILGVLSFGLQKLVQSMTLSKMTDLESVIQNFPKYVYLTLADQMIVGSISAVMASVTYYLLRAEKEGTSAAELAAVFD